MSRLKFIHIYQLPFNLLILSSHLSNWLNILVEKKKSVPAFLTVINQIFEMHATQIPPKGISDNAGIRSWTLLNL